MLASVRYFFLAFVVMISVGLNLVGSYIRAAHMNTSFEEILPVSNSNLQNLYGKYLWTGFGPYLKTLFPTPLQLWSNDKNLAVFSEYSKRITDEVKLTKLSIKTTQGIQFLDSNNIDISEIDFSILDKICMHFMDEKYSVTNSKAFQKAVLGSIQNRIIHGVVKENGVDKKAFFIKALIPISNTNQTEAVIEVYYDITASWKQMYNIQIGVTVIILAIISVIFVILAMTSIKAQKIINKQIEVNLELEEAKKKAEELSNQKSMFLANMSHELRTPLNSIIGFSDIIRNDSLGSLGNPQYQEYGNDIHSSGTHLLSLINDILDFSKAEADRLQVEQIEVDSIKMIKQCIRIVKPKADEAKITITDNSGDKHYILNADPKRLKQVFLNIMSNSIKFTPENGEVRVDVVANDNDKIIKIQISDTGIGIAPKDIAKVMQPFVQVESSLSKKHAGTGLGLPLTKKLVELMNGKFEITSEVGLGTTVTLTFSFLSSA
ncbi:MAG: hypothetical protein BGO27_02980 [Alphaproteobacteria bacterium 33-17]|nr:MAG: hypothetical protein BGO27_02980 [Alphaproteobacteria bacterium 33-17]